MQIIVCIRKNIKLGLSYLFYGVKTVMSIVDCGGRRKTKQNKVK